MKYLILILCLAGCTTDCDDTGYQWTEDGDAITDGQGRILKCDERVHYVR